MTRHHSLVALGALALVVGSALLLSTPALAAADDAPSLATRGRRFPRFTSARAAFEQEREVSLVDEVLRASGTIALRAPNHMRLELTAPEALTIVVDGDQLTVLDAKGTPVAVPPEFSGFARFGHVLTDLMLGEKGPDLFHEEWHGPNAGDVAYRRRRGTVHRDRAPVSSRRPSADRDRDA